MDICDACGCVHYNSFPYVFHCFCHACARSYSRVMFDRFAVAVEPYQQYLLDSLGRVCVMKGSTLGPTRWPLWLSDEQTFENPDAVLGRLSRVFCDLPAPPRVPQPKRYRGKVQGADRRQNWWDK